jgi:membrane-associated phospholipid phosphatase
MRRRGLGYRGVITVVFVACGVAAPLRAQTDVEHPPVAASGVPSPTLSEAGEPLVAFAAIDFSRQVIQQPAGPPPTPRHTGIKAMLKGLVIDLKYLPSRENLFWAGVGGGLALAVHPLDDNVNETLVGNNTAKNVFRSGAILGQLGTLMGSASVVYAVGRLKDQPRVSHVGMDLIQSLAISEGLAQTLKFATKRERPDHSSRKSFPSGHAADTFAFATALERHLGWRYAVPAYTFASYVAISRLPANRHWLSDAVFGSAVGIVAGRTVTSHEAHPFPVAIRHVPGGAAVMYVYRSH